ncbi:hypothetical protein [Promicromonospora sp. NPDC050880]|uniref:hypothetical protein n=1 Tax=unclassified Promicromonospora TaxID=2647929 RepID=UPI00379EB4CC
MVVSVSTRAVTTAALAALVAAASYVQPRPLPLAAAVVVLVVLVALGWPSLLRLPAPGSTRVVVALCGIGGAAVTYVTPGEPVLRHLPTVLAGAVVLAFVAQMLRRDGRPQLTESVSGTVAGVVAAIAASGWIAAARSDAGAALVVTSAVALAVAAAVSALPVRGWVALAISAVAAVLVGGAAGTLLPNIDTVSGLWCGLVAGLTVGALHLLLERLPARGARLAGISASALPVVVCGILVFVVGRMVIL